MARPPSFPAKLISMIIQNKETMNKTSTLKKIIELSHELNKTSDPFNCVVIVKEMEKVLEEYTTICCKRTLHNVSVVVGEKYNDGYDCKLDIVNPENIEII